MGDKVKKGSLAEIAERMKNEQLAKKEREQQIKAEAKRKAMERENEIKKENDARMEAIKLFEEEQRRKQQKRKLIKQREEENKNKVGLVIYDKIVEHDAHAKNNELASEFAKIIKGSSGQGSVDNEE